MVHFGRTYDSSILARTNTSASVAAGGYITWGAAETLRNASQVDTSMGFQVSQPGTYQVTVKFGSGEQESNMDFVLTNNGTTVGNTVYSGETLVARLFLLSSDILRVKNMSGVVVAPDTTSGAQWFSLTAV